MPILTKEYQPFEAQRYTSAMQALVSSGYTPVNTADLMRLRLEGLLSSDKDQRQFWGDKVFDTCDGIIAHRGEVLIVPDTKLLMVVDETTVLADGALPIGADRYQEVAQDAEHIPLTLLAKHGINRHLEKHEAYTHPGWLALARGNKHLVKELADRAFAYVKGKFGYDTTMGFYVPAQSDAPQMIAVFLSYLEWRFKQGTYGLLTSPARLIGVKTTASQHVAVSAPLEARFKNQ